MNQEQYHLLRAARPSGADEHEPAVVAARAAAAALPGMNEQLATEHALDVAMGSALHRAEPPPGFETAMLTAMRAARGAADPPAFLEKTVLGAVQIPTVSETSNVVPFRRRAWLGWGAAAAAALVAGSVHWWRTAAFSMHRLKRELAGVSKSGVQLSLMSMDPAAINGWMGYYKAPRAGPLPDKLAALPRKGCHLYQVDGHPVSLECFLLPGMRELHLFCTPAAALLDSPPEGALPGFCSVEGCTLATWTRGGAVALLFSRESAVVIGELLS